MVLIGTEAKLVNTQSVRLLQGANDYQQLYNLAVTVTRPSRKKACTDGRIQKLEGLGEHRIEGDLLLTVPEIVTFLGYTALVNRALPINVWTLQFTARDTTTDSISISAKLTTLQFIRPEAGATLYHIILETVDTEVTP